MSAEKTLARPLHGESDANIASISTEFGGSTGKRFIFWVIQFKQDGKLREALLHSPRKVDMVYDVEDAEQESTRSPTSSDP